MKNWRIAVVGAVPAGLVAAIAARKLGFDVKVFEQAESFAQIGGGISIHSNGQRTLDSLGILKSFEPQMLFITKGYVEAAGGKTLGATDFTRLAVPFNRGAILLRYQLQEHFAGCNPAEEKYFMPLN